MTSSQLAPAIILPFILWRVYLRVRRNIGRQPFQPGRLLTRVVIFSAISLLLGVAMLAYPPSLAALGGGLLLGAPLALLGLHLTRFERIDGATFYTPNTHIGLALSLLFVGRLAYRFAVLAAAVTDGTPPAPQLFQSPITLLIFGVTAGYYIAYFTGLRVRGARYG